MTTKPLFVDLPEIAADLPAVEKAVPEPLSVTAVSLALKGLVEIISPLSASKAKYPDLKRRRPDTCTLP